MRNKKTKTLDDVSLPCKMTCAELKLIALQLIQHINDMERVPKGFMNDTCPQVVAKIIESCDELTKANLLAALSDINSSP